MKKKLLFVINTMGRAGAEKALIALLKSLDPNAFNIDLLSVINRGEEFSNIPDYVNIINKNYECDSVLSDRGRIYLLKSVLTALLNKFYFIRYFPYMFINIKTQLKKRKLSADKLFWHALAMYAPAPDKQYDLAIAYTEGAATYYVADRINATKKAAFVHIDYEIAGYMKRIDEPYYAEIDKIFTVSPSVKENFLKIYPKFSVKTEIFQNILLPHEIKSHAESGAGFTDNFTGLRILTVARLHPQKGFDRAIRAFAEVINAGYSNLKWYVLGEGGERPNLEQLIEKYHLRDKFILLGQTSNPYPYFKQCDIYIQATLFEGWSISLAEALIFKKPCIVSNVAGNREQITNEINGLIVDTDETKLAEAIKRMADDTELRNRFINSLTKYAVDFTKDIIHIYRLTGLK